jgi:PPOX class probable F420-dependent enzyme
MESIPEEYHDIFMEKTSFASLATVTPDGFPHVTIVWVDYDPEENLVLVNTERERRKEVNMRRNPKVGVVVPDPDDPYRWVSVYGEVELTEEGAREHIDELAGRYFGADEYPNPIQTKRVLAKIAPEEVITFNPEG